MYYLLESGRIVTEADMRTAYEITYGIKPKIHPMHYSKWVNSRRNVKRTFIKSEITVEQLIRGECVVEAIKLYKEKYSCSLVQAKDAVFKLM